MLRRILLDACVAINLAATGKLEDIADTLQLSFVIVAQAAAEVGYLRDIIDGELVLSTIELTAPSEALEIVELEPSELRLYLELAALVDDGEAATIAVAIQRGIDVATDDRRARRLCQERHLAEPVRTVALLHAYAHAAGLADEQIRAIIVKVRDRASFQPARTDPDIKWWNDYAATSP